MAAWAGAAGWLAGTGWQLRQPTLAAPAFDAALVLAGLLLLVVAWALRRAGRRGPTPQRPPVGHALLLAAGCAALGLGSTGWRASQRVAEALPPALEGRDLWLTGRVAELPRPALEGVRFVFEVESARLGDAAVSVPRRVSLGWYRGYDDMAWLQGPQAAAPGGLRAGQRWRLPVRLRPPHGSLNPQGFDFELWLFERGIRASGSVRARAGSPAQLLDENAGAPVERARQALREAIAERVPEPATAGVLAALLVGDQGAIERGDWDLFRATGVAHLMSISGLHVTLFAWLAGRLIAAGWRRRPCLALACPTPVAAAWGGLAAAAAYALLAGWGVPAQRTVWMVATVAAVRSLGLRWPLPAVLGAAALVVSLADPWALLQPGFWLSFVAVGLLVASEPVARPVGGLSGAGRAALPDGVPAWPRQLGAALRAGLRTQAVATVGLAPLTLVFFQQVSLVGFVANLVAIPLVTLAVVPLAMVGVLLPWAWDGAALLLEALAWGLRALAAWPGALWTTAAAPPWAMAAGLLAGLLAVLPLPLRLRALALPLALPLLLPTVQRPAAGQFELVAADVGQGTAVLIRTRHHLLLYDAGPRYSPTADAGQRVLLPLLRVRGERRIDRLVLSHGDADHTGGAAALLAALPVAELSGTLPPSHPLAQAPLPQRPCSAGQRWHWDGVGFEVLHPPAADLGRPLKPNALSCVLRVQGGGRSVLLAGDIEAAQEAALVQAHGHALRSDALLVPHHGSRTSSTPAFIAAVAPRWAVVQAGFRSRYGHPAPEVMARYAAGGVAVVRSDRCGAWTWRPGAAPRCERQAARRYWHHPAHEAPAP